MFGTLQAIQEATPITFDGDSSTDGYMEGVSDLFGYIRGISDVHFGAITPLIGFVIFAFIFVIGYTLLWLFVPIIAVIFGLIRKVIQLVLDFIPG